MEPSKDKMTITSIVNNMGGKLDHLDTLIDEINKKLDVLFGCNPTVSVSNPTKPPEPEICLIEWMALLDTRLNNKIVDLQESIQRLARGI